MSALLTPLLVTLLTLSAPAAAAGCSDACAPGDHVELSEGAFRAWLTSYAADPPEAPGLALETLLFHGAVTREMLDIHGYGALSAAHRDVLDRELARDQVRMEMRLIDEYGELRGHMGPREFPLIEKQHFYFSDTGSLGDFLTGGKVKRVGLAHLWTRW